jgi:tripartite-type tricarboxylate transporter receptor subunit TctC
MPGKYRSPRFLLNAVAAAFVAASGARAQTPARVTIVVGTPVGGGYDAYARLVSRHIGNFLPGAPTAVVQNMPGGGSLIAANFVANVATKDGSALGIVPNGAIFEAMLGNKAALFDARKLNFIGSLNEFTSVGAVWHTTPFMNARDFMFGSALIGSSAANSNNSIVPNLLNSLVGTNFRIVNGYPGSTGVDMAVERGEVQGFMGPDWGFMKVTRAEWLREKKVRVLLQATLKRHPELPDVPSALEFASAENHDVLALLIGRQTYGGLFLAPPGIPEKNVATLKEAFAAMTASEVFREDARKIGMTLRISSAEEVTATMGRLLASSPDVIAKATAELRKIDPL